MKKSMFFVLLLALALIVTVGSASPAMADTAKMSLKGPSGVVFSYMCSSFRTVW